MSATLTRVVKLGGEVIRGAALPDLARQIAALDAGTAELDARVVVVHGGGPQTSALQKALGQTPNIVGGRRITDDAALEAIKMAVAGTAVPQTATRSNLAWRLRCLCCPRVFNPTSG